MKKAIICAVAVSAIAGCDQITIDASDRTPPSLAVTLVTPDQLGAVYSDGTPVSGRIDTSRSFAVTPRRDNQAVNLVFTARDDESGISQVRGTVQLAYQCRTTLPGGRVVKDASTTLSAQEGMRRLPGSMASPVQLMGINFTLEDLWRRGNCRNWGQIVNVDSGQITSIRASYSASAWNNATPASPPVEIGGRFSSAGGRVNLSD